MITFTTLGALDLRGSDGAVVESILSQPKRLAVLLHLALASPGGFQRRDTLLALFWPDSDAARARNALSQTLSGLRKALGDDVVVTRGNEEVGLDPERIRCDAIAFDEAVEAGRLEEALRLYQGDLAPGFHADASAKFDQWLEAERKRLRRAALAAARELAGRAREAGDTRAAVTWARRAHAIAPLSERAVGDLVDALAAVGDRAAALDVFEAFSDRLAAEYELEPSPELAERVRAIAEGRVEAAIVDGLAAADHAAAASLQPPAAPADTARSAPGSGDESVSSPGPGAGGLSENRAGSGPAPGSGTSALSGTEAYTVARRRGAVLAVIGILVVAAAGYLGLRAAGIGPVGTLISGGTVTHSDQILITDFASPSGELLGTTAAALLRTDFSMSNLLAVPDEREVAEALERMRVDGSAPDAALAVELAVREGYELVALGEIAPVGSGYVITARLVMPETGDVVGRFRTEADGPDDFVDAMDALSADMHRRIGESRARIRRLPPLAQVSTLSLEALKAYTEAVRLRDFQGNPEEAVPLFERAIAIDSTFGAAYRKLAITLDPWGPDGERRQEALQLAQRYRDRMTPYERFLLDALLLPRESPEEQLTYFARFASLYEQYTRAHPEDRRPLLNLGHGYTRLGRFEDAVAVTERAIEMGDSNAIAWANLTQYRISAGDLEGAERALGQLDPGSEWHAHQSGQLAMARGELRRAHDIWHERGVSHYFVFLTDLALGRFSEAERHLQQTIDQVPPSAVPHTVLRWRTAMAIARGLILPDRKTEAHRGLVDALHGFPGDSVRAPHYFRLADGFAHTGDPERARRYLEAGLERSPNARFMLPAMAPRASIRFAEGRLQEAIQTRRDADKGIPGAERIELGNLGRAYLAAGQVDSAVAAFEHLLANTQAWEGYTYDGWLLHRPLAHRALARIYDERGDATRAAEHYARLIELWRDADPDVQSQVETARERLEALRSDHGAQASMPGEP